MNENLYCSPVTGKVESAEICGLIDCTAAASKIAAENYFVLCQGHFEICVLTPLKREI